MAAPEVNEYILKMKESMIFRYLNDDDLLELFSISSVLHYKEGDQIITEGEVSQYLYAVLDGTVNVVVRETSGNEVFISVVGEGDVFGEAGIFLTVKRTANVVSAKNTTLLRIHRKDFISFIQHRPTAGIKILMIIVYSLLKKLRESNQELAFERKSDLKQDDIDSIVGNLMRKP